MNDTTRRQLLGGAASGVIALGLAAVAGCVPSRCGSRRVDPNGYRTLTAELLDLGVRLIVANGVHSDPGRASGDGPCADREYQRAGAAGWAVSLARPGGNITGLIASAEVRASSSRFSSELERGVRSSFMRKTSFR